MSRRQHCETCDHWRPETRPTLRALCKRRAEDGRILAHTDAGYRCRDWAAWGRVPKAAPKTGGER